MISKGLLSARMDLDKSDDRVFFSGKPFLELVFFQREETLDDMTLKGLKLYKRFNSYTKNKGLGYRFTFMLN